MTDKRDVPDADSNDQRDTTIEQGSTSETDDGGASSDGHETGAMADTNSDEGVGNGSVNSYLLDIPTSAWTSPPDLALVCGALASFGTICEPCPLDAQPFA